jgi:hypothetical protein
MAYGPNFPEMWKRAATYMDRILKGAKAGELPIERPSKFELVINIKTAKALGLDMPWFLQQRADRESRLARIMHDGRRFCTSGERARTGGPTGWIVCETTRCATRLG